MDGDLLLFHGPLRQGANARKAGEDMTAGQRILPAGRVLTAADLGTMTAAGVGHVQVRRRLRVGVLSTGDELAQAGQPARDHQIYDANRPMLCAVARAWGHKVVDLGCAPDDRETLRKTLDDAAARCDVILTSGGASAGDEDHMSALLDGTGSLALWRIAMKPGRPLALGVWADAPVLGLPGNPVAALVCALVFARPALRVTGRWHLDEHRRVMRCLRVLLNPKRRGAANTSAPASRMDKSWPLAPKDRGAFRACHGPRGWLNYPTTPKISSPAIWCISSRFPSSACDHQHRYSDHMTGLRSPHCIGRHLGKTGPS